MDVLYKGELHKLSHPKGFIKRQHWDMRVFSLREAALEYCKRGAKVAAKSIPLLGAAVRELAPEEAAGRDHAFEVAPARHAKDASEEERAEPPRRFVLAAPSAEQRRVWVDLLARAADVAAPAVNPALAGRAAPKKAVVRRRPQQRASVSEAAPAATTAATAAAEVPAAAPAQAAPKKPGPAAPQMPAAVEAVTGDGGVRRASLFSSALLCGLSQQIAFSSGDRTVRLPGARGSMGLRTAQGDDEASDVVKEGYVRVYWPGDRAPAADPGAAAMPRAEALRRLVRRAGDFVLRYAVLRGAVLQLFSSKARAVSRTGGAAPALAVAARAAAVRTVNELADADADEPAERGASAQRRAVTEVAFLVGDLLCVAWDATEREEWVAALRALAQGLPARQAAQRVATLREQRADPRYSRVVMARLDRTPRGLRGPRAFVDVRVTARRQSHADYLRRMRSASAGLAASRRASAPAAQLADRVLGEGYLTMIGDRAAGFGKRGRDSVLRYAVLRAGRLDVFRHRHAKGGPAAAVMLPDAFPDVRWHPEDPTVFSLCVPAARVTGGGDGGGGAAPAPGSVLASKARGSMVWALPPGGENAGDAAASDTWSTFVFKAGRSDEAAAWVRLLRAPAASRLEAAIAEEEKAAAAEEEEEEENQAGGGTEQAGSRTDVPPSPWGALGGTVSLNALSELALSMGTHGAGGGLAGVAEDDEGGAPSVDDDTASEGDDDEKDDPERAMVRHAARSTSYLNMPDLTLGDGDGDSDGESGGGDGDGHAGPPPATLKALARLGLTPLEARRQGIEIVDDKSQPVSRKLLATLGIDSGEAKRMGLRVDGSERARSQSSHGDMTIAHAASSARRHTVAPTLEMPNIDESVDRAHEPPPAKRQLSGDVWASGLDLSSDDDDDDDDDNDDEDGSSDQSSDDGGPPPLMVPGSPKPVDFNRLRETHRESLSVMDLRGGGGGGHSVPDSDGRPRTSLYTPQHRRGGSEATSASSAPPPPPPEGDGKEEGEEKAEEGGQGDDGNGDEQEEKAAQSAPAGPDAEELAAARRVLDESDASLAEVVGALRTVCSVVGARAESEHHQQFVVRACTGLAWRCRHREARRQAAELDLAGVVRDTVECAQPFYPAQRRAVQVQALVALRALTGSVARAREAVAVGGVPFALSMLLEHFGSASSLAVALGLLRNLTVLPAAKTEMLSLHAGGGGATVPASVSAASVRSGLSSAAAAAELDIEVPEACAATGYFFEPRAWNGVDAVLACAKHHPADREVLLGAARVINNLSQPAVPWAARLLGRLPSGTARAAHFTADDRQAMAIALLERGCSTSLKRVSRRFPDDTELAAATRSALRNISIATE